MSLGETLLQMMVRRGRRRARMTARTARLPNGETLAYLDGGRGPTLVLLHGFGATKDSFTTLARNLTRHHRVIAPDLLGFGGSDRIADADHSPEAQAQRLHLLFRSLGLTQFDLGGNSMGGQVALTYATLYPKDVQTLWLLNTSGVWSAGRTPMQEHLLSTGENQLLARTDADYQHLLGMLMAKPPRMPRMIRRVLLQRSINDADLHSRIFKQVVAKPIEPMISGLRVPTLITWGQQDQIISVSTVPVLRSLLPMSEADVLPDVGHLPMMEAPELCAQRFLRFREAARQLAQFTATQEETVAA